MRMFLNAVFDFKPKDRAFVTVPPVLREVLSEGDQTPGRLLFDLYDINDAASEGYTPHAKAMKRFPQLRPYWHNTSQTRQSLQPGLMDTAFSPTFPDAGRGELCSGRRTLL